MRSCLVTLVLLHPTVGFAATLGRVEVEVSGAVEMVLPGTLDASWEIDFPEEMTSEIETNTVPLVKVTADVFVLPWLGPSLSLHYAPVLLRERLELGSWDGREHVIPRTGIHLAELEGGIKGRWWPSDIIAIQPAVYLGFCRTFSSSPDARNSGLVLDAVVTAQWVMASWFLLLNAGVMTQLYGGVKDVAYVRSGPMLYLGAGAGL